MFKQIITSLALTVGLIHPSTASEQGQALTVDLPCVTLEALTTVLETYGERPMLTGIATRELGGVLSPAAAVLFVNPNTYSWTLIEKVDSNLYCAVAMGKDLKPYKGTEGNKPGL